MLLTWTVCGQYLPWLIEVICVSPREWRRILGLLLPHSSPSNPPPLAQARPQSQKSRQDSGSTLTPYLDKPVLARDTHDSKARHMTAMPGIAMSRGVLKRKKKGVPERQLCKRTACSSYVQPWLVAIGGW